MKPNLSGKSLNAPCKMDKETGEERETEKEERGEERKW